MAISMIGTELGHYTGDHEVQVTECGYPCGHTRWLMEEQGGGGEEKVLWEGGSGLVLVKKIVKNTPRFF